MWQEASACSRIPLGLSLSTAFSTRTQTGVPCTSRVTSSLGDPRFLTHGAGTMLTPPGLGSLRWSRPHPGPQPHVGAVQASPRSPGGPGDQGSRLCHVRAAPESGKGRRCPSPQPSPEGLLPREGAWEEAGLRHPGLRPALLPGLERGFQARVTCGTLHLTTGQRGGFSCRSLGNALRTPGSVPSKGTVVSGRLQ